MKKLTKSLSESEKQMLLKKANALVKIKARDAVIALNEFFEAEIVKKLISNE